MATMAMDVSTPPSSNNHSPSPTSRSKRHSPNLSIDLSDLPPLSQPSPASNTLLITNLNAPEIFTAANLDSIHRAINDHVARNDPAAVKDHPAIHTFSPLKSMRRVICTFYNKDHAIMVRQALDYENVLESRVRVYFGTETRIETGAEHLQPPKSDKLFFISPPPSPPMGWEMKQEDPPNKEVHAEDLAAALSRLHARPGPDEAMNDYSPISPASAVATRNGRARSGTGTIVYDPQDHGHSPDLPAVTVEDTSESPVDLSPMEGVEKKFVHTARPPVELMET